jgi:hypothetical protein
MGQRTDQLARGSGSGRTASAAIRLTSATASWLRPSTAATATSAPSHHDGAVCASSSNGAAASSTPTPSSAPK